MTSWLFGRKKESKREKKERERCLTGNGDVELDIGPFGILSWLAWYVFKGLMVLLFDKVEHHQKSMNV